MVASVLGLSGSLLICWEYGNIMPTIIDAINQTLPIANYDSIPP
jgi:hypothetical protein